MKVILVADVKGLGKKGATVEVAEGYGRNFLLPRGLAAEASSGAMKSLAESQRQEQRKVDRARRQAEELRHKIEGRTVSIKARVGEAGKLFGSITSKDIATAVGKLAGAPIDKRNVDLKEPIKSLGTFTVALHLSHDVTAAVKVDVVAE